MGVSNKNGITVPRGRSRRDTFEMREVPGTFKGEKGILRGIIHHPDAEPRGVAHIMHGYFSSNKYGPSYLYVQIARLLAENGYQVWRFDSYGVGDSDGDFSGSDFNSRLHDYEMMYKKSVQGKSRGLRRILIGHCVGGNFALRIASNEMNRVDKLILISPGVGLLAHLKTLMGSDLYCVLRKNGYVYRNALYISKNFIRSNERMDIFKIARDIRCRAFIYYGETDKLYSIENYERLINSNELFEGMKIGKGDHDFVDNLSARNELLDHIKAVICPGK
jgi:alpha-beta hydrolase superfamily lysophospholipase